MLSDGLLGDDDQKLWISCPLHKRNYDLKGEDAGKCNNDESVNIATFPAESREDGRVYVKLPPVDELDAVLGTERWRVRSVGEENPFQTLDKKLKPQKGRRGITAGDMPNGIGANGQPRSILVGGERGANGMDW